MSIFQLKCLAVITMIADHIGLFFFPHMLVFRILGRFSFPIFAWLIANGAYRTHDIHSYLLRLLVFAFLSQPLFWIASIQVNPTFEQLNIFFTLFLGLAAIVLIKESENKFLWAIIVVVCAWIANVIKADYGAMGVLSIVFFYLFYRNTLLMVLTQLLIYAMGYWLWVPFPHGEMFYADLLHYIMQLIAVLALFFIVLYNGKRGRKMQYFFYAIYPAQFVVIYLLELMLLR